MLLKVSLISIKEKLKDRSDSTRGPVEMYVRKLCFSFLHSLGTMPLALLVHVVRQYISTQMGSVFGSVNDKAVEEYVANNEDDVRELDLAGCGVTNAALRHVRRHCKELTRLKLTAGDGETEPIWGVEESAHDAKGTTRDWLDPSKRGRA